MFTSYVVNVSSHLFFVFQLSIFHLFMYLYQNNISVSYIKNYLLFLALMPLLSSNIQKYSHVFTFQSLESIIIHVKFIWP